MSQVRVEIIERSAKRPTDPIKTSEILVLGDCNRNELVSGIRSVNWDEIYVAPQSAPPPGGRLAAHIDDLHIPDLRLLIILAGTHPLSLSVASSRGVSERLLTELYKALYSGNSGFEVIVIGDWKHCSMVPIAWSKFDETPGQQIDEVKGEWSFYFSRVERYAWSTGSEQFTETKRPLASIAAKSVWGEEKVGEIEIRCSPIAKNRLGQKVSATFEFRCKTPAGKIIQGTSCIMLPETKLEVTETVNLILKERYGIGNTAIVVPGWFDNITKTRMESTIREDIAALEAEKLQLERRIEEKNLALEDWTQVNRILYCQDNILEQAVSKVLISLGAEELELDPRGNKEDAIFHDGNGRYFLAEFKGFQTRRARTSELRQLHDHKHSRWNEDLDPRGIARKPILIVNHEFHKPPHERNPVCLGSDESEAARREQCVISAMQLYRALVAQGQNALDIDRMWESIHTTNGLWKPPSDLLPEISWT